MLIFIYQLRGRIVYFLYADESGQTHIKRSKQDNGLYILSGVLVHEKDRKSVEKSLDEAKQEMFPNFRPCDWELHAHEIWNDREFFSKEELGLTLKKKKEIFSKIVDLVCGLEITIVSVVIFKDKLTRRSSPEVMKRSWRLLIDAFEGFLRQKQVQTNSGLLYMDSSQKIPESEIRNFVRGWVRGGGNRRHIHHVLEDLIFVESHMRNLIQLADMIAYVMHKHYKNDSRFERWFKSLEPKMHHSGGRLYGFGIKELPNIH